MTSGTDTRWTTICPLDRLTPDRGVGALVEGRAVAVFRLSNGDLHVVDDVDPCSGASVLSRGIVGDAGGNPTVASPLYKQRFDLTTGHCLDADVTIAVHDVRCEPGDGTGMVLARLRAAT
jgi:nitrite reductase (NADH) small subunit